MKTVQFMSAKEKELVLKQFKTFIENGLQQKHFTSRLYEHLHLHCAFIAHYNISGFYGTYFNGDYDDIKAFISHFLTHDREYHNDYYCMNDYADINIAIANVLKENYDTITNKAKSETKQKNINIIKSLMAESNITLSEISC